MSTIQVKHAEIMGKLSKVKTVLSSLDLPHQNDQTLGKNKLDFSEQWKNREAAITANFAEYIKNVSKNIEDTLLAVESIKKQDEEIGKIPVY